MNKLKPVNIKKYDICLSGNIILVYIGRNIYNTNIYELICYTDGKPCDDAGASAIPIPKNYTPIKSNTYWGYNGFKPEVILERRFGEKPTYEHIVNTVVPKLINPEL